MLDVIMWVMLFAVLAGAGFVGWVFLYGQAGFGGSGTIFGPKAEKRLDIVDQTSLDARRRLVLIRRDNVEHLIMTGGPVDVVIETGIGALPAVAVAPLQAPVPTAAVTPSRPMMGQALGHAQDAGFGSRAARTFGTVAPPQQGVTKAAE